MGIRSNLIVATVSGLIICVTIITIGAAIDCAEGENAYQGLARYYFSSLPYDLKSTFDTNIDTSVSFTIC